MIYLDTSALVTLVVRRAETDALRASLGGGPGATFSSMLAHVELLRAVQPAGESAAAVARAVLGGLALVDVTREILEAAAALRVSGPLQAAHGIHLATAMAVEDRLDGFVAYDADLRTAALELGLRVVTPGLPA